MSDFTYPAELEIIPLAKPPNATVTVPGSKSITNRALVLAALSSCFHNVTLSGALRSEDTEVMVEALRKLGYLVDEDWPTIFVRQNPDPVPADSVDNWCPVPASSADSSSPTPGPRCGSSRRCCALGHGRYRLDGIPRMRERPIEDLLDCAAQLGVNAHSEAGNGCPPVIIESRGLISDGTVDQGGTRAVSS